MGERARESEREIKGERKKGSEGERKKKKKRKDLRKTSLVSTTNLQRVASRSIIFQKTVVSVLFKYNRPQAYVSHHASTLYKFI